MSLASFVVIFDSLFSGLLVNSHILCLVSSSQLDIEWATFNIFLWLILIYTQTILFTHFYFLSKVLFCQISYQIVDAMIWLGIRDIINDFRKKRLKLRPVTYLKGSYCSPHDVPYGYLWSPHLVPKPKGHFYIFPLCYDAIFN